MNLEDKTATETVAEIFAAFEASVNSEFLRIEEMRKESALESKDAAKLRLSLRQFAEDLRLSLNSNVPIFARKPNHQEPNVKSRFDIVREAMDKAEDNQLLKDAIHAISLSAGKARDALMNIKPEDRWRGVVRMFLLAVACYALLFLIDLSSNAAKRTECDALEKTQAACQKKDKCTNLPNTCETAKTSTNVVIDSCNRQPGCTILKQEALQQESKNDDCKLIPGKPCNRIAYTINASPHKEGSAQKIAIKTITLLLNLLFVLSVSGFTLALLRALGIRLGDKIVDMLLDGLKEDKGKSAGVSAESGKQTASGLAFLLSAKGIIGATIAVIMSIAAVNSYQQSTNAKDSETRTDNKVVEKYSEVIREIHTPTPPSEDLKMVLNNNAQFVSALKEINQLISSSLNMSLKQHKDFFDELKEIHSPAPPSTNLTAVLEKISGLIETITNNERSVAKFTETIEKACHGKAEHCPAPPPPSGGVTYSPYSPSNSVSLLDEKSAKALGEGLGTGFKLATDLQNKIDEILKQIKTLKDNSSGAVACSPANNVSLLDEKATTALGASFGSNLKLHISDGKQDLQDLRELVKQLTKDKDELRQKTNDLQAHLTMYCVDLVKLEYEVKADLKSIKENAVISNFPGHEGYFFDHIHVNCNRIVTDKCNSPTYADNPVCKMIEIPTKPAEGLEGLKVSLKLEEKHE